MSEAAAQRGLGLGVGRRFSDERLTRLARKGDERAFTAIFRRYHQDLYRFCLAILGDPQDAQDALQNTMVKVLRALPGEQRRIELKPWLYRIAHNESIDLARRRRAASQLDAELAAQGPPPAEEAAVRERLRSLLVDLDELSGRRRGALIMRELAGLNFAEIAVALDTSPAAARQALYEARLDLRQMEEGREMSCQAVTKALSDADGRVTRRRDIRAHLRECASCRRFGEEIKGRKRDLAMISPLPAVAAAGLLHGVLGGQGASGAGLAGALGGGAAKTIGASALLKAAATVAVVAAVGVGAADRGGLVHLGLPGESSQAAPGRRPDGAAGTVRQPARSTAAGAAGEGPGPAATQAGGDAGIGRAQATKAASKKPAIHRGRQTATPALAAPLPAAVAHPHGRGHEESLPSASANGQQTAATHKAAGHGPGGAGAHPTHPHPTHPPKPTYPTHPSDSNSGKGAPSNATGKAAEHEAQPPAGPTRETGAVEASEASAGAEVGRKP